MKTIKQVVRQPLKSIAGIIMVALAVAILVTCVGQYAATSLTRANLNDTYNTVALLSDTYFWENLPGGGRRYHTILPEEYRNWIDNVIQNRTDLVKEESYMEVYSAYAPGLAIDNFSWYENGDKLGDYENIGNPYRCAMLEVTLTKVGTTVNENVSNYSRDGVEWKTIRNYISILCVGEVERVVGLEQGFDSPVGKTIALTITAYDEAEFEAMDLQAGQRYLVYGMDYSDTHGEMLESNIMGKCAGYEELFGSPQVLNEPYIGYVDYSPIMDQIGCYMTVYDHCAMPEIYPDENGEMAVWHDLREFWYLEDGELYGQFVSVEEYPDYHVPTIVRLDGTTEEYLASEEASLWQRALDEMDINNHAFPVIAVDKLGYQVAFSRGEARIVEGRDFTEEERTGGSKVCVISETVATLNELAVGDTIDLQTYAYDPNIEVQSYTRTSTTFPSAALYSHNMGFTSEMETYTIVGLYRQNNAWQNREDDYGFTPNTIFVPKGSISGDRLVGASGIYYTLVLHNGKMKEFQELQEDAGYPNLFICLDQGYTEIAAGLDAYEGVSANALNIGIVGCVVIMILFLLLFPCQQGKTLATMSSLGASRGKRIFHIVFSSVCLFIPGTALGGLAGLLLWERVAATLMESVNVQLPLDANMTVLVPCLTAGVSVMTAIAILLVAVIVSGNKGLMRRK